MMLMLQYDNEGQWINAESYCWLERFVSKCYSLVQTQVFSLVKTVELLETTTEVFNEHLYCQWACHYKHVTMIV